ncbi:MAG: 16S rRNA (cytosine(1402)-N(4))-methyltransferase RsmH [Candidatus Peribacteraceae bacterium]
MSHIPVLRERVIEILRPNEGEHVLDVTLGLGGHAEAFLRAVGEGGRLTGIDADTGNIACSQEHLLEWKEQCTFIHANFRSLATLGLGTFDIIFADLGVSSPHLDDPTRGFTFRSDAPLDLRFDQSSGRSAADILSDATEDDLKRMLREYGELHNAGKIASTIYAAIRHEGIKTTWQLKSVIEKAAGFRAPSILPQVFQALRIRVNDELAALEAFLHIAPSHLNPGGRLGIISYHSLEDRLVKQTFRSLTTPLKDSITGAIAQDAPYQLLTPKGVKPSENEIARNPRARSAIFRAIAGKRQTI